jgi:hypothetical protein
VLTEDMHPFEDIFVIRELAKKLPIKLVGQLAKQGGWEYFKKGLKHIKPSKNCSHKYNLSIINVFGNVWDIFAYFKYI